MYFTQEISAQGTGNTEVKIGAVDGSHNSGLDYYYLAVHGQAATEVTSNGSLPYYDDYNALLAAPGEGWTVGKVICTQNSGHISPSGITASLCREKFSRQQICSELPV